MALDKTTGKYGAVNYVIGEPTAPKPVQCQPCVKCGADCYRQNFRPGKGWRWIHYGCQEDNPVIVRRYAPRTNAPMGYVPRNYTGGAHGPSPAEVEGFKERKN